MAKKGTARPASPGGNLGTFAGVFTPSILTILGIILFRRLGYVVGQAGLLQSLVIITVANVIALLTSISVAAIATNIEVKGGGDYYLISRTLGVEFGGAIGLVLFCAQSLSIAFYCLGFAEAVVGLVALPDGLATTGIALGAAALLFFFAWAGADWATRLQFVIMGLLAAALLSLLWGGLQGWNGELLSRNLTAPGGWGDFWMVFAIFFPAVTGFTQGISMSGDLKDPATSIPRGTFAAVGLSIVVYTGAAVLVAASMPCQELAGDYDSMRRVARFAWLIDCGVIGATLSSAMASFMGAPRILQALAADKIFPLLSPFAAGVGESNNPRRGVLLSLCITIVTILLGNLNLIAPVVSMFFLVSYGLLNYATFFETRAASPSYRPRFRWSNQATSLLGALGCFVAMLAISPTAGVVALALLTAIYYYVKHNAPVVRWADGNRSYSFQVIREQLFEMAQAVEHPRDWRPVMLAFSAEADGRQRLLHLAAWLDGDAGLTSVVHVIEREGTPTVEELEERRNEIRVAIGKGGFSAFPLVISARDLRAALSMLLQAYGVGPLQANMVLLEWPDGSGSTETGAPTRRYGRYLHDAVELGCSVIALKATEQQLCRDVSSEVGGEVRGDVSGEARGEGCRGRNGLDGDGQGHGQGRRIDVWWSKGATGRLMVLLAYLMTRTDAWQDTEIRVIAPRKKESPEFLAQLQQQLEAMRIDARAEVLVAVDEAAIIEQSQDADFVFMPLCQQRGKTVSPFDVDLPEVMAYLPAVAATMAAEDIDLTAAPDDGLPAKLARLAEAALEAERQAEAAEETLKEALTAAEQESAEAAEAAEVNPAKQAELDELRGKARRAREKAERFRERAELAQALPPRQQPLAEE